MDLADIFRAGGLNRFREWNLPNRVSALIKQRAPANRTWTAIGVKPMKYLADNKINKTAKVH